MPGFTRDCCSRSSCHSTCGSSWHHRCIGMSFAHPLRTPMKWSLNVPTDLLHKFLQWFSGGTSSYIIFDVNPSASFVDSMASLMRPVHWLSRICCFGTMPCRRMCLRTCVLAAMSDPGVPTKRSCWQHGVLPLWICSPDLRFRGSPLFGRSISCLWGNCLCQVCRYIWKCYVFRHLFFVAIILSWV